MKKQILTSSLLIGMILFCIGCSASKTDWKDGLDLETTTWSNTKKINTVHILFPAEGDNSITIYKDSRKMKAFANITLQEEIYDKDLVIESMKISDVDFDGYDDFSYCDMNDDYKIKHVYLYDASTKSFSYSSADSVKTEFDPDIKKLKGIFYADGNINKEHMKIKPDGTVIYYSGEEEVKFEGYIHKSQSENGYNQYYIYKDTGKRYGEMCGTVLDEPEVTNFALDVGEKTLTPFYDSEHLTVTTRHGFTFYEKLYADLLLAEAVEYPNNHYYLYDIDGNGIKELIFEDAIREIFVYTAVEKDGEFICQYSGWIHSFGPGQVTIKDGAILFEEYEGNEHAVHKMGIDGIKLTDEISEYTENSQVYEGEPLEGCTVDNMQLLIDNEP